MDIKILFTSLMDFIFKPQCKRCNTSENVFLNKTDWRIGPQRIGSNIELQFKLNKIIELIKNAKEKEMVVYQGVVYNIKTAKQIFQFKCPIVYYENTEDPIIIPRNSQFIYRCLYLSADGCYFLYTVYDSGDIKIDPLLETQAMEMIRNHQNTGYVITYKKRG